MKGEFEEATVVVELEQGCDGRERIGLNLKVIALRCT